MPTFWNWNSRYSMLNWWGFPLGGSYFWRLVNWYGNGCYVLTVKTGGRAWVTATPTRRSPLPEKRFVVCQSTSCAASVSTKLKWSETFVPRITIELPPVGAPAPCTHPPSLFRVAARICRTAHAHSPCPTPKANTILSAPTRCSYNELQLQVVRIVFVWGTNVNSKLSTQKNCDINK